MTYGRRLLALLLTMTVPFLNAAPAFAGSTHARLHRVSAKRLPPLQQLDHFVTKNRTDVTLYAGDVAVTRASNGVMEVRLLSDLDMSTHGLIPPDRSDEIAALNKPPASSHPYVDGELLVVVRPGTELPRRLRLARGGLAAHGAYSNDAQLNAAFSHLGVAGVKRLFTSLGESRIGMLRSRTRHPSEVLPIENTYMIQISHGTVPAAIAHLKKVSSVLLAEPNFHVSAMDTHPIRLTKTQVERAQRVTRSGHMKLATNSFGKLALSGQDDVPNNYDVEYSGQSMLNAPGVNAIAAYDEIERHFHQLPGNGEIITNVSVGDVIAYNDFQNQSAPCYNYISALVEGSTVSLIGNQRYLEMPSLPAIPVWVADDGGNLDPNAGACGEDASLGEVGLDFSVMAALPHQLQQPSELGNGYSDLLGIAPGASYRLVVPKTTSNQISVIEQGPTTADLAGTILGAALQNPEPNVITMSLGWGDDTYGFPSRYLEEDPIIGSIVAMIVAHGIVTCISSGDGLRMYTNAAVGPSGGTVPLDTVTNGETYISDDALSTTPSLVFDSGAIAVGGTTLDDVNAAPPNQAQFAQYRDQLAFPETRWTGFGSFASSYGTRVNISAPSDNILSEQLGGTVLEGGTSASAPEVAAAAAVALQVAKLTGRPFANPLAVRQFLVSTARPVPNVPQADVTVAVGPQLNVGKAVESLLRDAHVALKPHLNRVAVAQRYPIAGDFVFTSDTDPTEIDLDDGNATFPNQAGSAAFAPITIAPDWEELPAGTKFRLFEKNQPRRILAHGPWARLFPQQLLAIAGQPLYSMQPRTVNLTYQAYDGFRVIDSATVGLTFAPNHAMLQGVGPGPEVPPVVTGDTIPVSYDISAVDPSQVKNPAIIVSYPGRMSTWTTAFPGYKAAYTVPISQKRGTVQIPVTQLPGDGIYGIAVRINDWPYPSYRSFSYTGAPIASMWSYTRVATAGSQRPAAPILTYEGDSTFPVETGHAIDVSYNAPFQAQWNVGNVKGASGAILEISAPGPSIWGTYNTFNNPNGSKLDGNGVDTGSSYELTVSGVSGTAIINPWPSIVPSNYYTVRVLPVSGGQVVGEAGDVSTIVPHGIIPNDGGNIVGGFDVNVYGSDGVLTSNQLDGDFFEDTSVQRFDQQSMRVTGTMTALSTSTGASQQNVMVPMYTMNGFSIDDPNDAAYLAVSNGLWAQLVDPGDYGTLRPTSLLYLSKLQAFGGGSTFSIPAGGPTLGDVTQNGTSYLLSGTSQYNVTNITPLNGVSFGTPVAMSNTDNYATCNGFGIYGTTLVGAFSDQNTYFVSADATSGQTQPPIIVPGIFNSTCGVSMVDGYAALTGESTTLSWGQSMIASSYGGSQQAQTQPLYGYVPFAVAPVYPGTGGNASSWVVLSALGPDFLTNNNAMSALDYVDLNLVAQGYAEQANFTNLPLVPNNRFLASGLKSTNYFLGSNGYEISSFDSGWF